MRRFLPGLTVMLCASIALAFPFSDVPPGAGLALQATAPGTAQTGSINLSGTATVGTKVSIGTPSSSVSGVAVKAIANAAITGTSTCNNSVTVVGVGTLFTTELGIGDAIAFSSASSSFSTVASITDDTHLTMFNPAGDGTTQTLSRRARFFSGEGADGIVRTVGGLALRLMDQSLSSFAWAGIPSINGSRFNGTRAVPTAVLVDQSVLAISGVGYDGSNVSGQLAQIGMFSGATQTTTDHEGYMVFKTTPSASTTLTERLRIRSDGLLSLSAAYTSSLLLVDGSNIIQKRAMPTTCTLNGGTPSTCTITVTTGSTVCWCSNKGASAAIAALGCAWGVSGTTLTITSAATASHDVSGGCY